MERMKIQGSEWQTLERLPDELWGHWQARQGVRIRRNRLLVALSVMVCVTTAFWLHRPGRHELSAGPLAQAGESTDGRELVMAYAQDDWFALQADQEVAVADEEPQTVAALFEAPSFPGLEENELTETGE